ncbi:MAG: hypothetical protein HY673_26410 [Chloroflexi bacterium]|nr:hypothetical protein [Chloroflexota bacterium]
MAQPLSGVFQKISRTARALDLAATCAIYGVAGLTPLAFVSTSQFIIWETPKVALLNILTLVALAAWLNRMLLLGRLEIRIPPFFIHAMAYPDV